MQALNLKGLCIIQDIRQLTLVRMADKTLLQKDKQTSSAEVPRSPKS